MAAWSPPGLNRTPVEVQGLLIRPGEEVLVVVDGVSYSHRYTGEEEGVYWTEGELTSFYARGPGPWPIEMLRHPDILTGLAKKLGEEG